VCSPALAQPTSAREHFAHGVELAELGDFSSAAAEFEEAYRISPHYAVQYNLGQAYAALGKSIEAARAFEMYLEGGGQKIAQERQSEVQQLILQNKKRVGYVAFELDPPDAKLFIDGRAIDTASLQVPTSLIVGVHGIGLTLTGFQSFVGSVNVESQTITAFKIRLERAPTLEHLARSEHIGVGQVAVDSELPELEISVDGVALKLAGKDPFLAPVGPHRLQCKRVGYDPVDAQIDVIEKSLVRVACNLGPSSRLPASDRGAISFNIDPPGAEVWIDGRRSSTSTRLPKGLHALRIRRWGFIDWTRTVTVQPGFPQTINVQLEPTPEYALEIARANSKRRTYAYVIGGTGIALLGTSAVLYTTNNARYQDWAAQPGDIQTALSIRRQDDAALGAAVIGGVMLGYAVISWLSSR